MLTNEAEVATPLTLAVPASTCRPGDTPDFSDMVISEPGVVRRPEVTESAQDMHELATELIRVLDDKGNAVGPWAPVIDTAMLVKGLTSMMVTREFDRRMFLAQRQAKTSFFMQSTGEEAISTGFRFAMRDDDMNFPTYRQQSLLIAGGYPLELMMSQIYSNSHDPLRGRQLPGLYSSKDTGFFTLSGNVATQFLQAVGWAMASAIKGSDSVTAAWIGDGSSAESDFFSAMLMASSFQAPVILNLINNQWAISTSQSVVRGQAATFAVRGHGFGLPSLRVDGNDFLAVYAVASWAVERARRNLGPTFIEWVTYRVGAHSSSDDPSAYRPKSEAAAWPLGDPIERLTRHLIASGAWTEDQHADLEGKVKEQVRLAQAVAEEWGTLKSGPGPSPRDIFEDVYADVPEHLQRQRREAGL